MVFRSSSSLIRASTWRPSIFGRFRSSRIRSGRVVWTYAPSCLRKDIASMPSVTTLIRTNGLTPRKASCVSRRSPWLFSTRRTCRGMLCSSHCRHDFLMVSKLVTKILPSFALAQGQRRLSSSRQLGRSQPEIVDALYQVLEGVQLHRLAKIAVGVKLVTFRNVFFRIGRGQDHDGNGFQAVIPLDQGQDLAAIHPRHV